MSTPRWRACLWCLTAHHRYGPYCRDLCGRQHVLARNAQARTDLVCSQPTKGRYLTPAQALLAGRARHKVLWAYRCECGWVHLTSHEYGVHEFYDDPIWRPGQPPPALIDLSPVDSVGVSPAIAAAEAWRRAPRAVDYDLPALDDLLDPTACGWCGLVLGEEDLTRGALYHRGCRDKMRRRRRRAEAGTLEGDELTHLRRAVDARRQRERARDSGRTATA